MEGNDCYKYQTIQHFLKEADLTPISKVLEVGTNVGNVTLELAKCFPSAHILSYEVIEKYALQARAKIGVNPNIQIELGAITSAHLFEDDLGEKLRPQPIALHAYLGLPKAGAGWMGGSYVGIPNGIKTNNHEELNTKIPCFTLLEVMQKFVGSSGTLDYLKTDSEGSECSFLGCADRSTLKRIRYIAGEYHNFSRFWPVAKKLMATHYLNLMGGKDLGAFFCELRTDGKSLLQKTAISSQVYPFLHSEPIWWHQFDETWITPGGYRSHGIAHKSTSNVAYIVCGPTSSGNRLLASILCRSGCRGEGSTRQPQKVEEIPTADGTPYVVIKHEHLPVWIKALKDKGYLRVVGIVMVREPYANISSMFQHKHIIDIGITAAFQDRNNVIVTNIVRLHEAQAEIEILSYEGLNEESLKRWLPHIGLEYKAGDLKLPGQLAPRQIEAKNDKHYLYPSKS
jgi:Methyltransferase FkbM domain